MVFFIFFLVLCVLAFLAGVPLNGYVLFITSCRVERTVSAVWFLNRAVADLIFIIFLPLGFTAIYLLRSDWVERLISTVICLHLFSSTFLLMALSIHRCILVARPAWAQNHCTPRLAVWVVLGMWALSVGFGLRYTDLWKHLLRPDSIRRHFWPNEFYGNSDKFWMDEDRLKDAVAIQFLVGFLIPLTLILIPTFHILLAAKLRRNRLRQSKKPLKILLGLVPTFFLCWLPYHVFCFLLLSHIVHPTCLIPGYILISGLTYFNSCLNPIFYFTMEDEFLRYRQRARNPQTTDNSGP